MILLICCSEAAQMLWSNLSLDVSVEMKPYKKSYKYLPFMILPIVSINSKMEGFFSYLNKYQEGNRLLHAAVYGSTNTYGNCTQVHRELDV